MASFILTQDQRPPADRVASTAVSAARDTVPSGDGLGDSLLPWQHADGSRVSLKTAADGDLKDPGSPQRTHQNTGGTGRYRWTQGDTGGHSWKFVGRVATGGHKGTLVETGGHR